MEVAVVFQRTARKCAKVKDSHAEPFYYSINVLFSDALTAVMVAIWLNSFVEDGNPTKQGACSSDDNAINLNYNYDLL